MLGPPRTLVDGTAEVHVRGCVDEETYASVRQAVRRGALVEPAVPAGEECWVIVFGFSAADMEKLMQVRLTD